MHFFLCLHLDLCERYGWLRCLVARILSSRSEQVERAQSHTQVEKSMNCERREAHHLEDERQMKMRLERAQWREQQDRSQESISSEQVERAQWHTQVDKSIICERREADHSEHERRLKMQLERAQ